ncbi:MULTISPECIES: hypothetical protein [Nitrosopumilus]|nr:MULTISPECIES: hypothetical protein [Nitrosopumilus]
MEPVKVKFDWDKPSLIENNGHNQGEWGQKPKTRITAYKMSWE